MSFLVSGKIDGLMPLLKRLRGIEDKVRGKVTRKAVAAGGKVVLKKARQLVPTETKLLKRSLGQRVKLNRKLATAYAVVGPRRQFREAILRRKGKWSPSQPKPSGLGNPTNYAHLVEKGARQHSVALGARLARRGKPDRNQANAQQHPGHGRTPFLEPAALGQATAIREAMADAIKKEF